MATQSPFSFFGELLGQLGDKLHPPPWVVDEVQNRAVLLMNHVLMQEPQAVERLARQTGRIVLVRWRAFSVRLAVSPAGLLERAPPEAAADLSLTLTEESPAGLAQAALRGDKPSVRIEGDVQLAADLNWLVDNLRWDIEEDLSRLLGDAPAHALAGGARRLAQGLREFLGKAASGKAPA
ncbi:MAG: hypothetical protein Q7T63_11800 [Burkholderiaceae bacterium]|nr:hypothetical protein [Burkholderiaceae bacterium]MDO9089270.1 hypothetical protein [Burkholderiaceae bacterium]